MKKCPNCGRELHDDAIFCFGCMSEINQRKDIELRTQKKVTIRPKLAAPIAAVVMGSAAVFGVFAYNNSDQKNTAVQKDDIPPQPTTTVTTSTPVTTTLPPATTTTAATTTTKPEPDKSALASDIAEGAKAAEGKATAVTTVTTTAAEEKKPSENEEPDEHDNNANTNNNVSSNNTTTQYTPPTATQTTTAEPTYYSADGAIQSTLDFLAVINPEREKNKVNLYRASGQLDSVLANSLGDYHIGIYTITQALPELIEKNLEKYGLPSDASVEQIEHFTTDSTDYNTAYSQYIAHLQEVKNYSVMLNYTYMGISKSQTDYMYVGTCFYPDPRHGNVYVAEIWFMKAN